MVEKGWMAGVVDRISTDSGGAGATATQAYLDLLAEAVSDQFLSEDEGWSLARLAAAAGIPEVEVRRLHVEFASAVRAVAESDGVVTADEHRELHQIAGALGVSEVVMDLRPTGGRRKATRVLVLGASAGADRLRAQILAEGVQLAKKLTASVTHLVYGPDVPGTDPRVPRAVELGAQVLELAAAPAALGFEHAVPRTKALPTGRPDTAPERQVLEAVPISEQVTAQAEPVPPPAESNAGSSRRTSTPTRPAAVAATSPRGVFAGRALMAGGLVLMLVTVVALFGGAGVGAGIVIAVFGVGALVGGWYVEEESRLRGSSR